MPDKILHLQYSIPCEKPLVSEGNQTSIILVLEKVLSELPKEAPEKLLVPFNWSLVTLWTRGNISFPKPVEFEQKCVVTDPQGDSLPDIINSFTVSNEHLNFRNIIEFPAFPITQTGMVTVDTYLRKKRSKDWIKFGSFQIMAERKVKESDGNKDQP
jgi:hypothetical protein